MQCIKHKEIRYIFCDLDGTLLRSDKTVSTQDIRNIKRICKMNNFSFGIATGRALTSVIPLLKKLNLLDFVDCIVANNGVDIYENKQSHTRAELVEEDMIKTLLSTFKDVDYINVCFHNPRGFYANHRTKRVQQIMDINEVCYCYNPYVDISFTATPRVMFLFEKENTLKVKELMSNYQFDKLQGMFPDTGIFEFMRTEVSKDKAIATYVAKRGDTLQNVLVFGDSYNDLTMLQNSGIGIAMHNGEDIVKKESKFVSIHTNDEGGVCHMLQTLYREKKNGK